MLRINEFKSAMKWGYPAFPFFTSVYFLLAENSKRKYFTKWDLLCKFKNNQMLGYSAGYISIMGDKIIKELLQGKDDYYKTLFKALEDVHNTTDICLNTKKENKLRNLNYWWKPGQKVFSDGANLIFGFDSALNDYIENIKEHDFNLYQQLKSNIIEKKESFMTLAVKDLNSLVEKYPNDFSRVYHKFMQKYQWLQNSYLGNFDLTEDWLKKYYNENKNKKRVNTKEKVLSLDHRYKLLVETSKLGIVFRDHRKKMFLILIGLMDEWLSLICQENNWNYEEMKWLSMGEVLMCLDGDKKLIKKAKKYSLAGQRIGLMNSVGLKDVSEKMFSKVEFLNSSKKDLKEFKGAIGNKGIISGVVKVILDIRLDSKKFRNGDILVTSMTRPEFLPLMSKASAYITDEGGITCHAGIVARELNKPCIVGTKNATQILKDGDIVEVDANKGIVKIIKK